MKKFILAIGLAAAALTASAQVSIGFNVPLTPVYRQPVQQGYVVVPQGQYQAPAPYYAPVPQTYYPPVPYYAPEPSINFGIGGGYYGGGWGGRSWDHGNWGGHHHGGGWHR